MSEPVWKSGPIPQYADPFPPVDELQARLDAASKVCVDWAERIEDALQHGGELNSGSVIPRLLRELAETLAPESTSQETP